MDKKTKKTLIIVGAIEAVILIFCLTISKPKKLDGPGRKPEVNIPSEPLGRKNRPP